MAANWLNSDEWRALGYGVAGVASIHMGLRERSRSMHRPLVCRWPAFWLLTAGLLVALAIARALDIDELVTRFGRSQARLAGWYRTRRGLQATLLGSTLATCMFVVIIAVWWMREHRRRYLPMALVAFATVCFAATRLISLHHVDAFLHGRTIGGVRIASIVEWFLIAAAIVATYWHTFARSRHAPMMPARSTTPS